MDELNPITRMEKFLAGEDLEPITRLEHFIKKYKAEGGTGGGGVKTVNGEWPDKNGDVKVCEALKDVGKQGFEPLKWGGGALKYDFFLEPWTGTEPGYIGHIMSIGGLLSDPEIRCFEVNLDNVTYLCPTHLVSEDGVAYDRQYIGNGSMMFEDEEDNGLPFIVYYDSSSSEWSVKVLTDGEHDMSIIGGTYTPIQVPEELVPQKVIAIPLDELKNYTENDLKAMLKNKRVINLLEYDFSEHSWWTYTLSGYSVDDGDGPMGNLIFTSLSALCEFDTQYDIHSVTYTIRTIIFTERNESHYLETSKTLS